MQFYIQFNVKFKVKFKINLFKNAIKTDMQIFIFFLFKFSVHIVSIKIIEKCHKKFT